MKRNVVTLKINPRTTSISCELEQQTTEHNQRQKKKQTKKFRFKGIKKEKTVYRNIELVKGHGRLGGLH